MRMPPLLPPLKRHPWFLLLAAGCASTSANPASVQPRSAPSLADLTGPVRTYTRGEADDTERAALQLDSARRAARSLTGSPARQVNELIRLGSWDDAESRLLERRPLDVDLLTAEANLKFHQHRYGEAGARVSAVLTRNPNHRAALMLATHLQIQAWDLDGAQRIVDRLIATDPNDRTADILSGRIALLRKDYGRAERIASDAITRNPANSEAYLLLADTKFWTQDADAAEDALRQALALDPFNADARFAYGYAIWRRVDATQLDAMAAQWELALQLHPLHYLTHWHWGNGHTNLTYADYAEPSDSIVRQALLGVDSLVRNFRVDEALERTRTLTRQFPRSVLPVLARGSIFYMAYNQATDRRLDSAQAAFTSILERKVHYGPAHNGLAAVIKARQFQQLRSYDSLEQAIAGTPIPVEGAFQQVFPDVALYPGERVGQMVLTQLGPSRAYLPMLARLGRRFALPPLHHDLAQAMDSPFFRTATTFDNRQWMDIRGVGSGATGIEYLERGAHLERNVLAHEYVHLIHGNVFTDEQSRKVRALYYQAMAENRTLDYYASNNESEFLAQAYPAYLAPVKVHPLNHKSMNTRSDLETRDPDTFTFVEQLIRTENAALAGDTTALAGNWAQVYINLAQQQREDRQWDEATALLDTALMWHNTYQPTFLAYAALERSRSNFETAERWIGRATAVDSTFPPIFLEQASLRSARDANSPQSIQAREALYRRALDHETDFAERARIHRLLRTHLRDHGDLPGAAIAANAYWTTAPTISTYLRDQAEDAAVFAADVRRELGYGSEALNLLTGLVDQNPQNYNYRASLSDAFRSVGDLEQAQRVLQEGQAILRAGGSSRPDYDLRLAEIAWWQDDRTTARAMIDADDVPRLVRTNGPRAIRLFATLGIFPDAVADWERRPDTASTHDRSTAEALLTRAVIRAAQGDRASAITHLEESIRIYPYSIDARVALVRLLVQDGNGRRARMVVRDAQTLPTPLGPDFTRQIEPLLR